MLWRSHLAHVLGGGRKRLVQQDFFVVSGVAGRFDRVQMWCQLRHASVVDHSVLGTARQVEHVGEVVQRRHVVLVAAHGGNEGDLRGGQILQAEMGQPLGVVDIGGILPQFFGLEEEAEGDRRLPRLQ